MRKLRISIVFFSIAVFAVFAAYKVHEYRTTDNQPPVITAESETLSLSVEATDEELLRGMSAMDNLDGDVTDSFVVVSLSKFVSRVTPTRIVNYAAFDKNNNVATYTRELTYTDYEHPHFILNSPLRFRAGSTTIDYLENMDVEDVLGSDLRKQIKITMGDSNVISDALYTQKVNFSVTNSAGDISTLELTATMEDPNSYARYAPSLPNYILYTKVGEEPAIDSLVDGIWLAGEKISAKDAGFTGHFYQCRLSSDFDKNTPGVYQAVYTLIPNGRIEESRLSETVLTIVVEE